MSLSSRLRRVAAVVTALVAIACAGVLSGAFASAPRPEDPNERLALRLSDLPPGYFPLDIGPEGSGIEFLCDGIQPTDPSPKLDDYVKRFDPVGCLGLYLRLYRVPGPTPTASVVGTGALRANHLASAIAGFDVAGELLGKLVEDQGGLEEIAPTATVGETTRLFHWNQIPKTSLRNDRLGSFLVWRSGRVVSAAFAAAPTLADSDRIALELAQRQQAHVEHPTVYTEAERDSSEVGLDDPAATFPVHWLGHEFTPGRGLPTARLQEAYVAPLISGNRKLFLRYTHEIELEGWTDASWKRFLATKKGRELQDRRCVKSVEIPGFTSGGVVFAGNVRGFRPCAKDAPRRFYALVRIGGTVITVNFTNCPGCVSRSPYNSLKGMKAIIRGLELRPQPVFSAPARR